MRRKPGALTQLESALLYAGLNLQAKGEPEFFGYQIGRLLEDIHGAYRATGYSNLYRALDGLEDRGFLRSRLEPEDIAEQARRPQRRLYHVTGEGARAHAEAARVPVSQRFIPRLLPG
jgi:DNA-binding PadR family transcriptional regulator